MPSIKFQYAATLTLNHEERITKFKNFIDKCDWKTINYPIHKKTMTRKNRRQKCNNYS